MKFFHRGTLFDKNRFLLEGLGTVHTQDILHYSLNPQTGRSTALNHDKHKIGVRQNNCVE